MNNQYTRLFHRDFTIMIVGQIMSLFGNNILRFALSLYVLDLTGSAAIFGTILAVAMIPTVILSPVGGVLADRLPKQKIMVALDFLTAALILVFDVFFSHSGNLTAITLLMLLLALIQAFYQPSVQASIPCLTSENNLMAANGTVVQVQALASLLGPILGGFLYGYLNLFPILLGSCACFFLSAVMELFLRIPHIKQERTGSAVGQVAADLKLALHYLTRENRPLMKLLVILAGINLFLSALLTIGLPFLIKIYLGLSAQLYGFAEGAMGLGMILGGLLAGLVAGKVGFSRGHLFLLGSTLSLFPSILSMGLGAPPLVSYGILMFTVLIAMTFAALFNITTQTFVQRQTPPHLLGKVGAFVSCICTCALPLGQAMYGGLFQLFRNIPWLVVLLGCLVTLVLVRASRSALQNAG